MNFKIRPIVKEDNSYLSKIIKDVFIEMDLPKVGTVFNDPTTDDLYGLFEMEGSYCFVAEADGKVFGCGGVYPTTGLPDGYAEFSKYYICPDGRGKGIGKQLLINCIAKAKELGYKFLYLESFPTLTTALEIYKKIGFKQIDSPLGNSGHYGCSIWMVYDLDPPLLY